ncbi:hypothetical protein [Sinorhizobium chiapasense]|uniref:Transposase n=1 Tax=Sinorhizobium chiapasense TaxID=501572 RepID=A0ABZ2BE30_9HYPH
MREFENIDGMCSEVGVATGKVRAGQDAARPCLIKPLLDHLERRAEGIQIVAASGKVRRCS